MRTPQDLPHPRATALRTGRGKWWIIAGVVVLVVLLASLKSLATLYTDSLWFSSVGLHRVWSTLLAVKVGLFASFGAIFFVLVWANLAICDRLAQRSPSPDPEDELVRRYQRAVRPYTGRVHAGVALVLALIAASGTVGEWNNWILFTHATSFGVKDPQFGMDVGFFVFRLPFLQFLVDWTLVTLVVVLAVTVVFHYLNGGIRLQRAAPRVRPAVKAHLSVILAMIALVKAGGYVLQRFQLDMSTNGYVEGAGYSDVHARLPALEVLLFISLFAAVILLYNIRRRGWTLPVLAIGLWAFVALVIGVIYPAVLQALTVNPAQSHLELPYIKRNIAATRAAYGLQNVQTATFQGTTAKGPTAVPAATLDASRTTLQDIRLWDPDPSITQRTFQKKQNIKSYYAFQSIGVDRYTVNGTMRPVVIGVRQINPTDLPSSGWVNAHLQYTHGEGVVLAPANQATPDGNPTFGISDVPPHSAPGYPTVAHPQVYYGLNQPGYVVADTRQPELTYQKKTGTDVESHYQGSGGVPMSSWLTKAAFAVRLGDFNLLVSNLITPQSKMMFVRTVVAAAKKAAPFLSFDSDPYAAVVNHRIVWILDAYTTTANYPYSQNADTQHVPPGSGLPASYNYVRNSVKVVVDAYSGKMTFYAMDNDPILRAYESAFPGMFTSQAVMPSALRSHLRYPENMFAIQAAVYGRYHITGASQFYNAGNAWTLSPTTGAGSPQNTLRVTVTTNAQGLITGGSYQPMAPIYQVLQEPGWGPSFTITDAYVPAGQSSQILSAFIMGNANPGKDYEQLRVYETPPGSSVNGPVLADAGIQQTGTVSRTISLLNQRGSQVLLGNILMVPIGTSGMLYVRPLYVQSSGNPQPQLKDVIAVYGQTVAMKPTLAGAIDAVFNTNLLTGATSGPTSGATSGTGPSANDVALAHKYIQEANTKFAKAETALRNGTFATYQNDLEAGMQLTQTAEKLLGQVPSGSSKTSSGSTGAGSSTTTNPATTRSPASSSRSSRGSTSSGSGSGGTSSTSTTTSTSGSSGGKASASATSTGSKSTGSGSTASGSTATGPTGSGATTTTTAPGEA